jgi:2-polyprenyl-3-methyl-5-hydroxy-6-metoxy-1,4-benzoquinol methylase
MVCVICKSNNTSVYYRGNIRDGIYPKFKKNQIIYSCLDCKSKFLNFLYDYSDDKYRLEYNGESDFNKLKILSAQLDNCLKFIDSNDFVGKSILDVGCGNGFLVDHFKQSAFKTVVVEKNIKFYNFLEKNNHVVFSDLFEVNEQFDLITCFNVIEHIDDVVPFVSRMYDLLNCDGKLVIQTPNCNDYLNFLLPDTFGKFFFRTVHRNYFCKDSLINILKICQIENYDFIFSQQYGINNLFNWVKFSEPGSLSKFSFSKELETLFKKELEFNESSDHITIIIKKQ